MTLAAFVLLGVGMVFIILEVFIPSLGLFGTIAAGSLVGGAVLAYRSEEDIFGTYLMLTFVLGPIVSLVALKLWPQTPMGRKLMLAGSTFDAKEAAPGSPELTALVGKTGDALSALRPAGKAVIDGHRIDVLTRGEWLEVGSRIRVLRVEANRVFVAALKDAE